MAQGMRVVDTLHEAPPTSLYVHIPFCSSRCFYCDFTTYVAPAGTKRVYVDHLVSEFRMLEARNRGRDQAPLKTIFFGGGTPTLLTPEEWDQIFTAIRDTFPVEVDAEITVEANPGSTDRRQLETLARHGVNRMSFGAQTFDHRLLMTIGRTHEVEAVFRSVELAREFGIQDLNIDLMFGLPEQTLDDVEHSLAAVLELGAPHVSAYWLKVEPNTPFAKWQKEGVLPLPGEDAEADMYELVCTRLKAAGFDHYEVSNFAKPGREAKHNLVYWYNEPYYAAGVGAHGYVFGERYENVPSLAAYGDLTEHQKRPVKDAYRVDPKESCENTMMLGLRLAQGVAKSRFLARHGVEMEQVFGDVITKLIQQDLLTWRDDALCLTERAWPIANVVFEQFVS